MKSFLRNLILKYSVNNDKAAKAIKTINAINILYILETSSLLPLLNIL